MTPRYHMQDQVHDRIKDLMGENHPFPWINRLPNLAAPTIIVLFLILGLNW
jgi:hypothetical protein